ncbi:hypothetical protein D9M72_230580 [compost metagenome]
MRPGSKRGHGALGCRRRTWSRKVPAVSLRVIRATALIRVRSSCESCCAGRTKIPPDRSIRLASAPEVIRPMIRSCSCCRYPALSSFQITRSTASPFCRQ